MAADKVGFLITTKPGDWIDYIKAFTDEWVKLGHPNNSIKKLPSGGANGQLDGIRDAAIAFQNDGDIGVIVTAGTGAALICKANVTKPFVYASVGDPALNHLVPGVDGTNFTGGNNRQADNAVVKARVDWMLNHGFKAPFVVLGNNQNGQEPFQTAMTNAFNYLQSLGHAVQMQTITPLDDIPTMISGFKGQTPPVRSIYVCSDPYLTVNSKLLNDEAHDTTHGQPYIDTMFEIKDHVNKHGGNAWYGSDFDELFETAADYAHKIISNIQTPGNLPNYTASLSGGGAAHTLKKKGKKRPKTKAKKTKAKKTKAKKAKAKRTKAKRTKAKRTKARKKR